MSMSCTVFSNRHLGSVGEWQKALDALGFRLALFEDTDVKIMTLTGHLPATWNDDEAGFECYPSGAEETSEFIAECSEFDFGGPWTCMMGIYYMGFPATVGAMMAAAAYAHATGGIVWESEGGDIFDVDGALACAAQTEREMMAIIAAEKA